MPIYTFDYYHCVIIGCTQRSERMDQLVSHLKSYRWHISIVYIDDNDNDGGVGGGNDDDDDDDVVESSRHSQ